MKDSRTLKTEWKNIDKITLNETNVTKKKGKNKKVRKKEATTERRTIEIIE